MPIAIPPRPQVIVMPHRVDDDVQDFIYSNLDPELVLAIKDFDMDAPIESQVEEALHIAREFPDGGSVPFVIQILEPAIRRLWADINAKPDSYIMTRQEFTLFNYFQYRFMDNAVAVSARARYWNNLRV